MFEGFKKSTYTPKGAVVALALIGAAAWALYAHPPFRTIERGAIGVRANRLTGEASEFAEGVLLVIPGVHDFRAYSLRDQVYKPVESAKAEGPAPFQSLEGLSIGIDLSVRYALDPARLRALGYSVPENFGADAVEPAVQGVIYKMFARYTVREIFSTKRQELVQAIETELRARLAAEGVALRGVLIGKVDLPADYRRGIEAGEGKRARSRGAEGAPRAHRARKRAGAENRGERGGEGQAEARGGRGVPRREGRQEKRRADGARRPAREPPSAAHPKGVRRQALRQGPGDHRAAAHGWPLHRLDLARQSGEIAAKNCEASREPVAPP